MQQLFALFRTGATMKHSLDSEDVRHISTAIAVQLKSIISKELVKVEIAVLSEVDKLVYGSETIGRQSPLAMWVCLWTLILSYKEHMVYANAYHSQGCS